MCGIAAIFAYNPDAPGVDEGELTAIRDHMTPRGPDGCGNWLDTHRRIGLGHRRLSIIDLSEAGAQPMHYKHLAIVFNGEIYNYRELRAALERLGHTFKSTCDTEVLLHLYAKKGRAMTADLRGMYAFVIWDAEKNGLFIARDPYGIKPLYMADDGKTLRVASQVKALLAGGHVDTTPEPAGHVGFFLWGHLPDPFTLYRGIRALPAGTSLWLDQAGNNNKEEFCSVTDVLAHAESGTPSSILHSPFSNFSVSASQLSALLKDSVSHHLIADVPVGVFLSSGLDSTTLAALAAEQGGQLRTVTLGFENYRGTADDETPLAETVARQYGAQHQTIWISRSDFETNVEHLFAAMDCPSTDGVNTFFVSLAAKRACLKVALSGLGGDELFGGYPSFTEIPKAVRTFGAFGNGSGIGRAFRAISAPVLGHFTSPKYAGLLEYGGSYGGAYLLRRGMFMPWELPGFLDPDFVRQGWSELQTMSRLEETVAGLQSSRAKVTALETCWYMRNQLLRDSDWAGMAHSLEIRVPLVDISLLRAVAPSFGRGTLPTKRDMAAAPRSALPAAVLNRPKTGFQVPIRQWLLEANRRSETGKPESTERGLRGWARYVHSRFLGSGCILARKSVVRGRRAEIGKQGDESRKQVAQPGNRQSAIGSRESTSPALAFSGDSSSILHPPSSSLRIMALVTDAYGGHGGIAKFNRDLLSALCSDPNVEKVTAIPRLIPEPPGVLPDKLKFVTNATGGKVRFALAVLRSSIIHPRPSVILCGHINLLPVAWLAKLICRAPLVLVIHGTDAWQATCSALVNRLVRRTDMVVSVSEFTRKKFWSWAQPRRAVGFILPNCVDLSLFGPGPKSHELLSRHSLKNRKVLMTVCRLSAQEQGWKGIDNVMEVLPELAKTVPSLSYVVVGDGTDRLRLERKASELGLRERIVFTGRISEQEKAAYYRLADAFVMAGRVEGFGIVYLEAMACGIPVIGSKIDASSETLRHGELGIVVNPDDREELLNGICEAFQRPRFVPLQLEEYSANAFEGRCRELVALLNRNHS